ncbi:WD40/YVTN/BNR-like repeat-containing protein [Methylocucumis oryzae]|uniref:Photosynthesis system II assembly factor Ycf48/Hcf136-like domain-containing protein n=1 Tax=Methylocucumis oryzae TaxID=1632867 RepID=A0A0F3ILX8_9GAMM|nr:hypothetical protein [Methylocucumis oryzae]KJV07775.1 hypothetical protein VZ94_02300 [Methylocucumis oryzae]
MATHRYHALLILLLIIQTGLARADWRQVLTLATPIHYLSAIDNKTAWVMTQSQKISITQDQGQSWFNTRIKGLDSNSSLQQLVALTPQQALLAASTYHNDTNSFTSHIYKTQDSGKHWRKVFSLNHLCLLQLAMSNAKTGVVAVNIEPFSSSASSGHSLLKTLDAGETWREDTLTDPSDDFYIQDIFVKNQQVWLYSGNNIYYSNDFGQNWQHEVSPSDDGRSQFMQFQTPERGIFNATALIDLYRKTETGGWEHLGQPPGTNALGGAVTALVTDGNECWLTEAFDSLDNYYSNDYCASFKPFRVEATQAFLEIKKPRLGNVLWARTQKRVFIHKKTPSLAK